MTKFYFALVFSVLLIITGCSKKTSDEYIALAEANIQKNDMQSAIVALKNAISVNAQDPRARFMLGNLYAQRGRGAAAEKELVRALKLGFEPNEVLPVLANVYSLQFKHAEIITLVEESRNLTPEVSTSLLLYKALAYFRLGEPYKAKKAVSDANEISSDSLYSKLGNAYVDFSNQHLDKSLEKINEILLEQPDFADAHLLKGQLTSVSKNAKGAVESFAKYKELLPETPQSRLFLANAYLRNKQFDEAEKELDSLLKIMPEQPIVNQMKGIVRYNKQDFEEAKLYSEKAIQNGMDNISNRVIAGTSAFRLQNFEQAFKHIDPIKDQLPKNSPMHKLLTLIQLKLGLTQEAGQSLLDFDELNENDIILLSSASALLLKNGDFEQAKKLVELADSIDYTTAVNLTQKGLLKLSFDELDGITDLENALQLDPKLNVGNTALARAYIDNGLYEKAYQLSKVWIEQKPNEVNGYILAAVSQVEKKNTTEAEKMYQMALSIDKANPAANIYFADKSEAAENSEAAVNVIYEVLKTYPDNLIALRKYFVLNKKLGFPEKGLNLIKESVEKNADNSETLLLYVQALYSNKQYDQVTKIAELDNLTALSEGKVWDLLANAHIKLGQEDESVRALNHWRITQPNNRHAFIRSINLQDLLGDNQKALQLVKSANQKFENDTQFRLLAAYFYMRNGQLSEAKSAFNLLPEDVKDSSIGKGVLGQILLANDESQSAIPLLKEFYEVESTNQNAMLVAKALKNADKVGRAFDFLKTHADDNEHTLLIDSQLAELSILNGNYAQAEKYYKAILLDAPENVRALNNLANVLILEHKYEEAVPLARKAAELLPENALILDTYSQVMKKTGRNKLALRLAQKAYSIHSDSPELSLNVAELLILNDKNAQAKEIIDKVLDNTPDTVARIKLLRSKL